MILKKSIIAKSFFYFIALLSVGLISSCGTDEDENPMLQSKSFQYQFHNGQTVATAPYAGIHSSDLSVSLTLEELENGNTRITVSIENSIDGETYHTHAHDGADPSTTPNGTPYNESPNAEIFAQPIMGNGGTSSISQEATRSYDDLVSSYEGFFVIHDPLQAISTSDIGTFIVLGSFAREQGNVTLASSTFDYAFNTGQIAAEFAYSGNHEAISASIKVDELAGGNSRVTVHIMDTMDGETYHTHAHDVADPATTPNGTPYNESPNADVFVAPIDGNGGTTSKAVISPKSHSEIISTYSGFFVIHDPLQAITTVDPTTYIILGSFAR